jgi:hypothetical protein
VCTLAAEEALVPPAARFDIGDCDERLWSHDVYLASRSMHERISRTRTCPRQNLPVTLGRQRIAGSARCRRPDSISILASMLRPPASG